jgi:hypothetical protein
MKQQSLLREEMMLQYKLGNFEVMPSFLILTLSRWRPYFKYAELVLYQAAAAIQKRLDPDAPPQ